jgi:hypothetical protein
MQSMKTLIATAAIALSLMSTANADTLPAFYLGKWCDDDAVWTRSCDSDKNTVTVTRNGYTADTGLACRFTSVRRGKAYPPATKMPMSEWIPSVKITAKCQAEDGRYNSSFELSTMHGGDITVTGRW